MGDWRLEGDGRPRGSPLREGGVCPPSVPPIAAWFVKGFSAPLSANPPIRLAGAMLCCTMLVHLLLTLAAAVAVGACIGIPTPTPPPTATPTPPPTATPTPAPTATPTPAPTATPTPAPTATPTPAPTATPTPAPSVRAVYAVPSDRVVRAAFYAAVRDAVLDVQRYYAGQLDGRTFVITGALPQVCSLPRAASHYEGLDAWQNMLDDLQPCVPISHHSETYTWIVYADTTAACRGSFETLGRGGDGVTIVGGWDLRGLTSDEPYSECDYWVPRPQNGWIGGIAHELGHAFD